MSRLIPNQPPKVFWKNYLDGVQITFFLFLLEILIFAERFCDFLNLGPASASIYIDAG